MRKILFISVFFPLVIGVSGQTISQKLQKAFQQFEKDSQLQYAISSLYVIDAKTGQVVFDKNSRIGLAPASTQKIVTAATAFELLGKSFRYSTSLGYSGRIINDSLAGSLYLHSMGDPTFGSARFASTTPARIFQSFADSLKKAGIKKIKDSFLIDNNKFKEPAIPDGWIWQDIGNYYGAGAWVLNWKENQYDLILKSADRVNGPVVVADNSTAPPGQQFINHLSAAAKGSGDNAYIYLPGEGHDYLLEGTIPLNENQFKISGAIVSGPDYFINNFRSYLKDKGILNYPVDKKIHLTSGYVDDGSIIANYYSPSLDSIIYWFLQKSINLYGEALIKSIGQQTLGFGSTETGVVSIKNFWKQKGINENELNIGDGSGLSPQNRVTTHAQVEILKYAKKQSWFFSFNNALPEFNNMKMKSGTIKDVKGYCGYHKAKDGKEYIFSFLVNNYNGPSSSLVGKMYRVLDVMK
jgi:D-alanyl-D-alanine carboxypeptidase/D-alanyl-D-alanine-endopeptidase (penicillin-binding protein 4)